jgi:WD40 repeat protein
VTKVRFAVDDRWIITASNDRAARMWDAKGQLMATFEHGDVVASVEVSHDGTTIVTGCRDGTARIWDLTLGSSRYTSDLLAPVRAIAISRDGRIAGGADDSRIWLWRPGDLMKPLKAHLGSVYAVAFSRDGTELVSGGDDESVFVWRSEAPDKPRLAIPVTSKVTAVAFGPDGEVIAGDEVGTLSIWSPAGAPIARVPVGAQISSIAVDPRTGAIVTASSRGVDVWSTAGRPLSHQATPADVRALAFDRGGEILAIAGAYDTVIVRFDGRTLAPVLTLDGPTGEVAAVALAPDASIVFTGGVDGIVRVWDATKGKLLATRDTGEAIKALALSGTELLWTGNADGIARALDMTVLRDTSGLAAFIKRRVPWRLGDDDVVVRAPVE